MARIRSGREGKELGLAREIASSTIGFAVYLSINAISIWGGFFPLLPIEFQTEEILIAFFVSQALSFSGVILAHAGISFRSHDPSRRTPAGLYPMAIFMGSACIILSMYFRDLTLALVIAGGVLLGGGCAGLFAMWQKVFAAMPVERGNLCLVLGAIATPFIYFAVNLAPEAIAAFLVPLFLAPLCGTCLSISSGRSDFEQPMFEDEPAEHAAVYRRVISDHWRSALCLGAIGFVSGVVRGVAVLEDGIVLFINEASLIGMLISASILLFVCCMRWIRVDLTDVFRIVYPALIVGFLLVPLLGAAYLTAFVTLTYFAFSLIQMLMMMQAAQISRNRGVHPLFTFGFFAGIAYIMQSIGFVTGWFGILIPEQGEVSLFAVSQISTFVLGMSLFVAVGSSFKNSILRGSASSDAVELFLMTENIPGLKGIGQSAQSAARKAESTLLEHAKISPKKASFTTESSASTRKRDIPSGEGVEAVRDMTSVRCHALKEQYALSIRELEVAELLVRGNTAPAIADKLVISEHTVKTHTKRIYAKLGIHKKQELLELVDNVELP
ncbi:MAG: LuxR family transcriptional regulator [Eggerthellaceae bacterium]|nr:LuxR family transcriptional regulator [Eggerthellaceae bacterium]